MLNEQPLDPLFTISHNLSLTQLRLWNFMLLRCYKNIKKTKWHSIAINDFLSVFSKNSSGYIKKQLLNFENNNFSLYFNELTIIDGSVYFSYPEKLIEIYNSINIISTLKATQNVKFSSKYALLMYMLSKYMLTNKISCISIAALRRFLGFKKEKYRSLKLLTNQVIGKSVKEINLLNECELIAKFIKNGKKIESISFCLEYKKNNVQSLASLKKMHGTYLESKAYKTYDSLPKEVQEKLEKEYTSWFKEIKQEFDIWAFADRIKRVFLIQKLVSPFEQDFELWSLSHGYESKKAKISI